MISVETVEETAGNTANEAFEPSPLALFAIEQTPEPILEVQEAEQLMDDELADIDPDDAVVLYLREAARVPLLTADEEKNIAKRIETGRRAREELVAHPRRKKRLGPIIEDGSQARNYLVAANTLLVISIAKKYIGRGRPFLDLVGDGNEGLLRATKKYDYRRGFKFGTYATWWIRQVIARGLSDNVRTIRIPVHTHDNVRDILYMKGFMMQQLQREPTLEELTAAVNKLFAKRTKEWFSDRRKRQPTKEEFDAIMKNRRLTPNKVEWLLIVGRDTLSLDEPQHEGEKDEITLGEKLVDPIAPQPEHGAHLAMLRVLLEKAIAETLDLREHDILRLHFGLDEGKVYNNVEIGREMNVSRERVRQIRDEALEKLKNSPYWDQLKAYWDELDI